jgi:hypothetical protein
LVSTYAHFGHSKVRFSDRSDRCTLFVKSMCVRHLTQRGHSIGESKLSVEDEIMRITWIRRELDALGHRQLPKERTVIRTG